MTRRRPPPPPRLQEHELTPLQTAALGLCRFTYGGGCSCLEAGRAPRCQAITEAAGQMLAKIVAAQGRAKA